MESHPRLPHGALTARTVLGARISPDIDRRPRLPGLGNAIEPESQREVASLNDQQGVLLHHVQIEKLGAVLNLVLFEPVEEDDYKVCEQKECFCLYRSPVGLWQKSGV